jgi:hypothetical protein
MTAPRDIAHYQRALESALGRLDGTVQYAHSNVAWVELRAGELDADAHELAAVLHRIADRLRALEDHATALLEQVRTAQAGHVEVLNYEAAVRWSSEDE